MANRLIASYIVCFGLQIYSFCGEFMLQYVLYVKSVGDGVNYKDSDEESINVSFSESGGATEEVIYSTEFNYNVVTENTQTYYDRETEYIGEDSDGKSWGIVYGNWNGSNCAQMRVYSAGNFGSVYTKFDLPNVTKVSYKAKVSNTNLTLNTYYSTDGGSSWTLVDNGKALQTTLTEYSFVVSATGEYEKVRIKFEVSGKKPSSKNYQLTIDDVSIYGMK